MKRILSITTILILAISSLVSCSESAIQDEEVNATFVDSTSKPEGNTTSVLDKDKITVEERVLLNQNDIKITLMYLENEGYWGPALKLYIENNSENDVTIKSKDISVNNIMARVLFSCNVQAGKKVASDFTFSSADLETAGIKVIKDIQLKFEIIDTKADTAIFESNTISITTSADPSYVQTFDDSGFVVLDENDFKIVIKEVDDTESFWGADIHIYIENNSNKNATVQLRDTSINEITIDPMFSCNIMAGKKAFDSITLLESDLEDKNIEIIENLKCSYAIFETYTFNTILNSDIINVNFQ